MSSPFDDATANFVVLVNAEHQHSLWPADLAVPEGWARTYGPATGVACRAHVTEHWTDLRPRSLADAMTNDR